MFHLICISGDLATGKSTFSKILSSHFKIPVFNKDSIKEVLGDEIGFNNREENLKLSKATMSLMTFIFKQFSYTGHDLILESNFHTHEQKELADLAKKSGYDVLTIRLKGNEDILYKRFMHRIQFENRHPVHCSTTLDNYDEFCAYIQISSQEEFEGKQLEICANDFSYQDDETILIMIHDFLGGKHENQ